MKGIEVLCNTVLWMNLKMQTCQTVKMQFYLIQKFMKYVSMMCESIVIVA